MNINNTQQNNFTGHAFLVDTVKNSFHDLKIQQHQKKLSDVSKNSIDKVNKLIANKPFDLFILKGESDMGEYFFYANTSFDDVIKSKPKFILPTVDTAYKRQVSQGNSFAKSAEDAIDRFNIVF